MTKEKKPCSRVISAIKTTPWAILPSSLDTIVSIAQRSYSDQNLAATLKANYQYHNAVEVKAEKIAIIDVFGPIFTRADLFAEISGACSLSSLEQTLDEALFNDEVKAIVMRIDSPGGEVIGTHEFANYLREASTIKPIVAYVSGLACSAAYWIGSAVNKIYADRTATVGSIGVVAMWTDDSEAKKKAGYVDYEIVSSQSPNKRLSPTSKEGKTDIQTRLDGLADIFIDDVAKFRGVTAETVISDFGQGGTLLAEEALSLGMIDEISSLRDVIRDLSQGDISINNPIGVNSSMTTGNIQASIGKNKANQPEDDDKTKSENGNDEPKEKETNSKANSVPEDDDKKDHEAIEDDEDEEASDEDEEKESASINGSANALASTNPSLYKAVLRRGARRERRRIASIDELGIVGHAGLVHSAKYTKPLTVAGASLAVMKADKAQRKTMESNLQADGNFRINPDIASSGNKIPIKNSSSNSEQTNVVGQMKAVADRILGRK